MTHRTKQDCAHNNRHRHGTAVAYQADGCGCTPCTDAYRKVAKYRNAFPTTMNATPVLNHINMLRRAGMGEKRIARTAQVCDATIACLIRGRPGQSKPQKRIRTATAEKILAVTLQIAPGHVVDATGTRRRLQALIAQGWGMRRLGAELGYTGRSASVRVNQWMHHEGVQKRTADRVAALYERLWDTPPPNTTRDEKRAISLSKNKATKNGWPPPMAWDDIDNDTRPPAPTETDTDLDPVKVLRTVDGRHTGRLTTAERVEAIKILHSCGLSDGEIGRRLGVSSSTIHSHRIRWHIGTRKAAA